MTPSTPCRAVGDHVPGSLDHLRRALRVAIPAMLLAGCTSEKAADPTCVHLDGPWDAQITVGSLVARQTWILSQAGCDLAIAADPGDDTGVALPAGGTAGSVWNDRLTASWTFDSGTCRYAGRLDAIVTGNALAGTVVSTRTAHQVGPCAGAGIWDFPATAVRR